MEISPRRLVRKDEVVEGIREIPASAGMTFEKDNLNGSSMLRSGLQRKSFCEVRTKDCSGKPVKTPKTFFDLSCLFEDFVLSIGQQMVNYEVILYLLYSF